MKLVMFGTGDFALPTFQAVVAAGHEVLSLVTQPDRPQGRKQELIPSPIKRDAIARGIPVFQPEDVNTAGAVEVIRSLGPELLVTAAYGQILSAELLGAAPLGGINLHGSILPRYRGAAPVARAIQNGETEAGVTVIRMTPRIDAGGMISIARTPIDPDETAGDLETRLAKLGAPLVVETIAGLAEGTATILPQSTSKVTRAPKLSKDESPIDWSKSAQAIHNKVRSLQPWPQAETFWHPSELGKAPIRLIVQRTAVAEGQGPPGTVIEAAKNRLIVAAGESAVQILTVQVPGKTPMPTAIFLNGYHVFPGDRMGPL
ncbi:MAG: fmt [Planctomycetota bacterium]|nr:fmt [Planctomycetota bacterium]